jgi:hypothetical protein
MVEMCLRCDKVASDAVVRAWHAGRGSCPSLTHDHVSLLSSDLQ